MCGEAEDAEKGVDDCEEDAVGQGDGMGCLRGHFERVVVGVEPDGLCVGFLEDLRLVFGFRVVEVS